MLRIDFYESGAGETILITFPDGSVGVVDAHPSQERQRPSISELLEGKSVRFLCLTHPHEDHGADLVAALETHPHIEQFWSTVSDWAVIFEGASFADNYRSPVQEYVREFRAQYAEFLAALLKAVTSRPKLKRKNWHANVRSLQISDVEISCISPSEDEQNKLVRAYQRHLEGKHVNLPDENLISAILILEYGGTAVLLGADALIPNWKEAVALYRKRGYPLAKVLKVPHHGAVNALSTSKNSYLSICSKDPKPVALLSAGDAQHPNVKVFERLVSETELLCVSNGVRGKFRGNPLQLEIPGAKSRGTSVCNPQVSVQIASSGDISIDRGETCDGCPLALLHNS